MAGLYIHIPFCKQRCIYCDFHSGTDMAIKNRYVGALCKEIEERKEELTEEIETIYFGGGTPSLLDEEELRRIFASIEENYGLKSLKEVTIECNPDDINGAFLDMLKGTPINRISVGIQSFNDEELRWLNRRHSAQQAEDAIRLCRQYGYDNISIDLMYSLPVQTIETWRRSLDVAVKLGVEHISSYTLMYEESSRLTKMYEAGEIEEVGEEESRAMFELLRDYMRNNGYEHYEISNFAKEGRRSKHNSSYWRHVPYLGFGAAAHSFDGERRKANVANTREYIRRVEEGERSFVIEELDDDTLFNEVIFTSLRTMEGLDIDLLREKFGEEREQYILKEAEQFISHGYMEIKGRNLSLTGQGIYVSDMIMSEFMVV